MRPIRNRSKHDGGTDMACGRLQSVIAAVVVLSMFGVLPAASVFAQVVRPKVLDIRNPPPRVGPATAVPNTETSESKPPAVRLSRKEQQRLEKRASQLNRHAAEIERLVSQAFQRSLVDIDDYAQALDVALQLRLAGTEKLPQAELSKQQAYRMRAKRLQQAAMQTARLRQPAAKGWASETALGKMHATNAAADVAKSAGNKPLWANLAASNQRNAQRLLQFRQQDYRMGHASDKQMISAISATKTAKTPNQDEARLKQLQSVLQSHSQRMQSLHRRPGGNVRPNERHDVRGRLQANAAAMELAAGRSIQARSAYLKAEQEYSREFQQLLRLQKQGTAGLSDLIRSWRQRTAIQSSLVKAGFEVSDTNRRSRLADLTRLTKLAEQSRDRRGRIAGDIAIVRGLSMLEQVRPLRHQPRTVNDSKPKSGAGSSRVVDVKAQLKNRAENIRTGVTIPRNRN